MKRAQVGSFDTVSQALGDPDDMPRNRTRRARSRGSMTSMGWRCLLFLFLLITVLWEGDELFLGLLLVSLASRHVGRCGLSGWGRAMGS